MTNYEHITNMAVEELTGWLFGTCGCDMCSYLHQGNINCADCKEDIVNEIKEWLESEVEE